MWGKLFCCLKRYLEQPMPGSLSAAAVSGEAGRVGPAAFCVGGKQDASRVSPCTLPGSNGWISSTSYSTGFSLNTDRPVCKAQIGSASLKQSVGNKIEAFGG